MFFSRIFSYKFIDIDWEWNKGQIVDICFQVTIPKDKSVFRYGKDITLSCQVKGYPIPVIRWYKNNTPVPKSSRYIYSLPKIF